MASGPLQIESIADRVYAVLRDRIVRGELSRGERLRQEALADELGVSRTPLREALRRLASEGFVELQPHRGAAVAGATADDIRASFAARLVLEPAASALAAVAAERRDVARMRAAIAQHRAARGDRAQSWDANREFHLAQVAASGNAHLARFAEILWASSIYGTFEDRDATAEEVAGWADEHQAILDAILAHDAAAAERLAAQHVADSRGKIVG